VCGGGGKRNGVVEMWREHSTCLCLSRFALICRNVCNSAFGRLPGILPAPKISGNLTIKKKFITVTSGFHRLLRSGLLGLPIYPRPNGTTSKETVETMSYGNKLFYGQISRSCG
jgi:hypothetical protein